MCQNLGRWSCYDSYTGKPSSHRGVRSAACEFRPTSVKPHRIVCLSSLTSAMITGAVPDKGGTRKKGNIITAQISVPNIKINYAANIKKMFSLGVGNACEKQELNEKYSDMNELHDTTNKPQTSHQQLQVCFLRKE